MAPWLGSATSWSLASSLHSPRAWSLCGPRFTPLCCMVVLLLLPSTQAATFLASSSLENCVDRSDPSGRNNMTCSQKLVVTFSLGPDERGTSQFQTVVNTASVSGASGADAVRALQQPLLLVLRKSPVRVVYPISYIQSVNNKPYELVVYTENILGGLFTSGCDDSPLSGSPNCGWALDGSGNRVINSQGFCCSCSFLDQIGITKSKTLRSESNCALFGSGQATAHCLRMDPLWYDVYEIGTPQVDFTISIAVYRMVTNTSATREPQDPSCAALTSAPPGWECMMVLDGLGPTRKGARTPDGSVVATFVGDFATTQALKTLSDKYLLVPESRTLSTAQALARPQITNGVQDWMIVDKTQIDLRGYSCNKIGVGYSAFQTQAGPCQQPVNSCLDQQPYDLWQSDVAARNAKKPVKYFVGAYGTFSLLGGGGGNLRYVAYDMVQDHESVVTVQLNADSIKWITQVSSGRIDIAFANDFQAITNQGRLTVLVSNTGGMPAQYSLSVTCSEFIAPVPTQMRTINPGRSWLATFEIYTIFQLGRRNQCAVSLLNAVYEVIDVANVTFRTNSTCICLGSCGCQCDGSQSVIKCVPVDDPAVTTNGDTSSGGGLSLGSLFGLLGLSLGAGLGLCSTLITIIVLCVLWRLCLRGCCAASLRTLRSKAGRRGGRGGGNSGGGGGGGGGGSGERYGQASSSDSGASWSCGDSALALWQLCSSPLIVCGALCRMCAQCMQQAPEASAEHPAPLPLLSVQAQPVLAREPEPAAAAMDLVYFNFPAINQKRARKFLKDPGLQFSLRGQLVEDDSAMEGSSCIKFWISLFTFQLQSQHGTLPRPLPLDARLFQQVLSAEALRTYVTRRPKYRCLN